MSLGTGGLAPGQYPAKFVFDVNATPSCANDYAAYALTSAGTTSGQASIVAFNNLYRGGTSAAPTGLCAGTAGVATSNIPTVMWAYNTTTIAGTIQTSPVLSLDGTKIAFIESGASGAVLHILKWKSGDGTTLTSAAPGTAFTSASTLASYQGCLAGSTSCMFTTDLFAATAPKGITKSSPFYVYYTGSPTAGTDVLLVGDDNGVLHRFDNVFNSAASAVPAEHSGNGWPVTVATAGTYLTSPVYDIGRDRVIVGDGASNAWHINTLAGAVKSTAAATGASAGTIIDGPLVDVTNGSSFFFAYQAQKPTAYQVNSLGTNPANLASAASANTGPIGASVYIGQLNDAYYTNPN